MSAQHLVRRAAAVMALVFAMPLGVASAAGRPDVGGTAAKPTIVLVHGAWADASGWAAVTERLQDHGYTVIALANPLRGVPSDAAYLTSVLATISGPIVLVGHSYGGAVITNAATGNPNVKALVFIAAKRAGATTREVDSSHVPMISQPTVVTDLIADAASHAG